MEYSDFIKTLDPTEGDALCIAGDFATGTPQGNLYAALREVCARFAPQPVFYVHGNHEHYGMVSTSSVKHLTRELAKELSNLHFLDRDIVELDGFPRILGATLWYTPIGRYNWSDFVHIRRLYFELPQLARKDVEFFTENLREGDVVLTHMLPSPRCIASRWQGSDTNTFFVQDLTALIEKKKPHLWMFGHTHDKMTLLIGDTMAVSHPCGYPHERNGAGYAPMVLTV